MAVIFIVHVSLKKKLLDEIIVVSNYSKNWFNSIKVCVHTYVLNA